MLTSFAGPIQPELKMSNTWRDFQVTQWMRNTEFLCCSSFLGGHLKEDYFLQNFLQEHRYALDLIGSLYFIIKTSCDIVVAGVK